MEKLAKTAKEISQGNFSRTAKPHRMDELGELAVSFNTITQRLVNIIEDVEEEIKFTKNVLESLSHPFYVIDVHDYTIKLANTSATLGKLSPGMTCYKLTHNSDTPCDGNDHPCTYQKNP